MGRRGSAAYSRNLKTTKITILAIIFVVVLLVIVMLNKSFDLLSKISANNNRIDQIERQLEEEKLRTIEIEELAEEVKTDEYIEQTARDKLGMIKDGDIVFEEY